ncbi:MFS transporter [Microbacterium marinilacus]|uniref:MFS transporter n=1 Tax=Microbacterium marinilacus TaxID=415209 RepID=A0ABP7BPN5_9MICO|nr:MFS transporter [Microbacterium marinilacus]MBY0689894.1 MFS transporter [Microbacterium marinilacus]
MSGAGSRRSHVIDIRPLTQSPPFARLWVGTLLGGLGAQLTLTAVMLHMFALTHDTFAVSMIAVAGLVPMVVAGLYGGMLADHFDRRTVALVAASIGWSATVALATLAWTGLVNEWWLYGLSIVNSAASTVASATKAAMTPKLVGTHLIPAAAALTGITTGVMVMAGPALGGLLVAAFGYPITYTIDAVLTLSLFLGLATLPRLTPEGETNRPGLRSIVDGLAFLKVAPNIRMQFVLDVIAMTFGQPIALFPALGVVLLGGGEVTSGILMAAIAVGVLASSLFSGRIGTVRRQGVGIARAIQAFGLATGLFGLVLFAASMGWSADDVDAAHPDVPLIVLACLCLALTGAADNISAIFRQTMLQAAVPDAVRGRLQGIFMVVVAGGPRIGALFTGTLAGIALWFPPLAGGVVIVVLVGVILRLATRFRAYDAENPVP